jgi:A/G-specific adenine glycosylase
VATGVATPPLAATAAETRLATEFLPAESLQAARWAVAAMELGALTCTARAPACERCPVEDLCAWRRAGRPVVEGPRRRQAYEGTDRQCRGALLAVLRSSDQLVVRAELDAVWPDPAQRERALTSLVLDGLVVGDDLVGYALPG